MKFPGIESSVLEFKRQTPNKDQILKTVIGFCNRHGGTLVIGVDDSGEIIGIPEEAMNEMIDSLYQSIYQGSTPAIIPSIHVQRMDGKYLMFIEVSSGMKKPYCRTASGLHEGTFIRVGTLTMRATPQIIEELRWLSRGKRPDEVPVNSANLEDINRESFLDFTARRLGKSIDDVPVKEMLQKYEIITNEHRRLIPTMGGMLLFGYNPQKFFPEAFIICTHFEGIESRKALATKDCTGTLLQQYYEALNFLQNRLFRQFSITDAGRRHETLEIPIQAIREALMNAIIHRNHDVEAPTKIAIYDDRVEFFSPGDFPGPIKKEELELGYSWIRNNIICRVFREDGLVEKLGSGFRTIFKSYRQEKLLAPIVLEGTGYVECILPRIKEANEKTSSLENRETDIMIMFRQTKELQVPDIIKQIGLSRQTIVRILNKLIDKGVVKRVGKGPGTKYLKKG